MKKFDKEKSIRHILTDSKQSSFQRYKYLVAGDVGFIEFVFVECALFFCGSMSGALGLFLRMKIYPLIFGSCGKIKRVGSIQKLAAPK